MNNVFDLDRIGRTFEIDNDSMLPEYAKRFSAPMFADAEISFECDIDTSLFAKIIGIDLAQGQDASCSRIMFQKPYQVQRKHHKKKRINKKWAKRYGYVTKFKTYYMEDVYIEQNEGGLSFTGQKILGY